MVSKLLFFIELSLVPYFYMKMYQSGKTYQFSCSLYHALAHIDASKNAPFYTVSHLSVSGVGSPTPKTYTQHLKRWF